MILNLSVISVVNFIHTHTQSSNALLSINLYVIR